LTAFYRLIGASDLTSQTFSFAWGSSHNGFSCRIFEITGTANTGTNGVDNFVQELVVNLDSNLTTLAGTFASTPLTANAMLSFLARAGQQEASTPKAGYTDLGTVQFGPPSSSSQAAWINQGDASPSFTWTTASRAELFAWELKAGSTITGAQRRGWRNKLEQLKGEANLLGARIQVRENELDPTSVAEYRKRLYVVTHELDDARQLIMSNADDITGPLDLLELDVDAIVDEIGATPGSVVAKPYVTGLSQRDNEPTDANIPVWNPEIKWRDLQSSEGAALGGSGLTQITNALASAKNARIRIMCGRWSPQWVKVLCGTVDTWNSQDGARDSTGDTPSGSPVWWETPYFDAIDDLATKLATLLDNDADASTINMLAPMTIYAEPFQKHFVATSSTIVPNTGSMTQAQVAAQNRQRAVDKGYTKNKDQGAWDHAFQAMLPFKKTNIILSINPYQYVGNDGLGYSEETYMRTVAAKGREMYGSRFILQNDSVRESMAINPPTMFDVLMPTDQGGLGKPVSMQTSTWGRISRLTTTSYDPTDAEKHDALLVTADYCIDVLKAHLLELPNGHTLTTVEKASLNTRLQANA
jgi:hypothetical protein